MNITVMQNGKVRDKNIIALRDEYVKRFKRYGQLQIIEKSPKDGQSLWPQQARWRILLDEHGEQLSSEQLAKKMDLWSMHHGALSFAIGESYGHDECTRSEANYVLSLSPMVLPHQLAHVFMVEQIYRAACILAGSPYHHGS